MFFQCGLARGRYMDARVIVAKYGDEFVSL